MLAQPIDDQAPAVLPHMVAEALVQRMSETEVVDRAKAVGLSGSIVEVAPKLCGCGKSMGSNSAAAK
ncbi:hypothetical protein BH09CHL1_BH09CHL1_32190 [soil metagenome]